MIIQDLINSAKAELVATKILSAQLDVMILLEAASGKDRGWLLAHGEEEISAGELAAFKSFIERRVKREPVAQILGGREFYGRLFLLSEEVLIPRPETETLVDTALKYMKKTSAGAPLQVGEESVNILDLGTGSGNILLTLLLELPGAKGTGSDFSKTALAIAQKNAYNLGVKTAHFVHSNWCESLEERHFNLIVSNPPYVAMAEKPELDAELDYEPEMALFGGDDGLECYRKIAAGISRLNFDYAIFEIGLGQENQIEKIFGERRIKLIETVKDLSGINRVMVFKKQGQK